MKKLGGWGLAIAAAAVLAACTSGGSGGGGGGSNDTPLTWTHPWPMFHGFETHLGFNNAQGPQSAEFNTFSASTDVGNPPNSVAVAQDGTIYLAGGNKVFSLSYDGTTVSTRWSQSYTSAQGPALSHDGTALYFGSSQSIVAVNTSDGSPKWTYATGGEVHFGPTVGPDGTVYQGSWDKNLYALNPADGSLKWSYTTAGAVSYPPSILNSSTTSTSSALIVLGGGDAHAGPDGKVYAFDTSGNLQWTYDTGQLRVGSPAIGADGLIYCPASPTLYVLNSSGALQWTLGSMGDEVSGIITPAIAADGTIYLPNSRGKLSAIDPATHAAKWAYDTGDGQGIPTFPVVDSQGTVYFGSMNKNIYAVDKNGNNLFAPFATGVKLAEAAPALVNGKLFISSDDGKLYLSK